MSFQRERLAEQLEAIDSEIQEIRHDLLDPPSASLAAQMQEALAVALKDRESTVEQLEALGLEDPDL